jgi:hypothetical protein
MHIGEGFTTWAVEKVSSGGNDYFVLAGGYYPTLGDDAPGVALVFQAHPRISLGADPVTAIYFGRIVSMLNFIAYGGSDYFYIAKDIGAAKFVVKKIN